MTQDKPRQIQFSRSFLLLLVIAITALFVNMIKAFLLTILLAAIFSGLAGPLFRALQGLLRGHRRTASVLTVLIVLLLIVVPLTLFFGVVATEAFKVSDSVVPWVKQQLTHTNEIDELLQRLPFYDQIAPYQHEIINKLGEIAGKTGRFLFTSLSAGTLGTVAFLFQLFVMLYAMYFFLISGDELLRRMMYYTPLSDEDQHRMLDKFLLVTRASLKGTVVIGFIQGGLAGMGFLVAGVGSAAFWGTVMMVLSIIPGLGTALVWVPAVIYLFAVGKTTAAILLAIWCAVVVGTVDNFLRPRLVGKDTKLPDLLVLLSTLGGIFMFGAVGFIIGPIIAALFVTVWEIYGVAFQDVLQNPTGTESDQEG